MRLLILYFKIINIILHFHYFKIKLQLIAVSTCCDKIDVLLHDELRAV